MSDTIPNWRSRADDPLRLAYAVRILTTPELSMPDLRAPEPSVLAGRVLFVPVSGATIAQCGAAKYLADAEKLDLVLADHVSTPGSERIVFQLGVNFYGRRIWKYSYRLWRPADASPACFLPDDWHPDGFYRVEGGCLFCVEGRPWRDRADRDRGFDAARIGLRRLIEGC